MTTPGMIFIHFALEPMHSRCFHLSESELLLGFILSQISHRLLILVFYYNDVAVRANLSGRQVLLIAKHMVDHFGGINVQRLRARVRFYLQFKYAIAKLT